MEEIFALIEKTYSYDLHNIVCKCKDAITELCDDLKTNDKLISYVKCELNSIDDIKTEFLIMLTNLIEYKYATYEFFEIYNLLTDDKKFFRQWSDMLFNYIYNKIKEK